MPGLNDDSTEIDPTVDAAARAIEGLLSDEEDTQPDADANATSEEDAAEAAEDTDEESSEESEEQSEDTEEEAPASQQPATVKVKVNGQDVEVTLEEALKGYSRTQDYTHKTQSLADERKAFVAEQTAIRAERQQYATQLVQLEQLINSQSKEPDWDALRAEDPAVFAQTHAAWQVHKSRMEALAAERESTLRKVQADEDASYNERLVGEHQKVAELIPDWKDETKGPALRKSLVAYGQEHGFSAEELNGVADSRALVMLHKALLYDKAKAEKSAAAPKAKAKIEKLQSVAPGSKGTTRPEVSQLTRQKQRLAKTGDIHDAAAAIELMLG